VTDQYPPPASVPPPDPTGNPAPPPPPFQPPAYGPPPTYPPQADPYAPPVDPQQAYAQQAYPPPGYQQPPGYPPPPGYPQTPYGYPVYPQADPGVNGFAIASLACGFFGIIGAVLATIFGIIALNQIGKRGQRGRGLAIAGLSLAAVWLVVLIAGIAIVVAQGDTSSASKTPADTVVPTVVQSTPTEEPTTEATPATTDIYLPGECLNDLNGARSQVPCTTPHDGEVYANFNLKNGKWPGEAAVEKQAEAGCNTRLDSYAKNPSKLDFWYLYPKQAYWPEDRSVTCIAADPKDRKLTGSVRR
jgi:hypothetical protein